jgi:hypothetical protein
LHRGHPAISSIAWSTLWHTASTEYEVVVTFGSGAQADIDVGVFRSLREIDGFAGQHLMGAVVDHDWREAS